MHKAEDIMKQIWQLDSAERRRLLEQLEDAVDDESSNGDDNKLGKNPYAKTLALAGTAHSDYTDVSSDKYKHLGEIYADEHDE